MQVSLDADDDDLKAQETLLLNIRSLLRVKILSKQKPRKNEDFLVGTTMTEEDGRTANSLHSRNPKIRHEGLLTRRCYHAIAFSYFLTSRPEKWWVTTNFSQPF